MLTSIASPVAAQGSGIHLGINKDPSIKITSLPKLLGGFIGAILIIAFVIALFFLFWGGIQWITSGGDKEGVEESFPFGEETLFEVGNRFLEMGNEERRVNALKRKALMGLCIFVHSATLASAFYCAGRCFLQETREPH